MSNTTVSEVVARPVRSAVQMAPAAVITEFIDAFWFDMADKQYTALFALLTLLFAWGQTAYENYRGVGFLRRVPPKDVPAVDNNNNGDGGL